MSAESQELIAQYREAVRAGVKSRRLITLLLLFVLVLNGALVKGSYEDFRAHGWSDFSSALAKEMANVDPALSRQAAGMFDRLMTVYGAELLDAFDRQKPALVEETQAELDRLETYAQARWPQIEQSLADIVIAQEGILYANLSAIASEEELETISLLYGEALLARLNGMMEGELEAHAEVAESIGSNLSRILEANPNGEAPVDSREIVAVVLELAGLNLQQSL